MRSRAVGLLTAALLCGATAATALAEPVPAIFPVTVTASTLPLSVRPYTFTFALFDVPTGGTSLWSEIKSYRLPATKIITHKLGSVDPEANAISPLLFNRQLWVEASVGTRKFPRVKLGVAPYAVRSELAGNIEGRVTAGQVESTGAASGEVLTADGDGGAGWQAVTSAAGGDITAVQTPAGGGLQGGVDNGAASLSLLRTCAPGEVLKWTGTAWDCAADADTDTNSGGTVTGITAGVGLTGGTITTSGTIAVDTAAIQARVGGTCEPGSSIRVIAADGSVTCEADDVGGGAGSGWALGGNAGTTPGTNFVGTTDAQALEVKVNGTRALRIEPTSGTPNLLGGYSGNEVTAAAGGTTIGGGGKAAETNRVTDDFGTIAGGSNNRAGDAGGVVTDAPYGTVGGGQANTASGTHATVGGGYTNTASGPYSSVGSGVGNSASAFSATVAGGQSNTASRQGATVGGGNTNQATHEYATVGGGWYNQAKGMQAVVAGGDQNTAAGPASTVPGGSQNAAGGMYSFAAGRQATVRGSAASEDGDGDEGTFVWADAQGGPFTSTGPNQFLVRAQNGVGINRNNPASALDVNGTVTATGLRMTTTPTSGYVLTSDAFGNGSWQPVAGSAGGTVTQVDTGAGLTGGPVTGVGTISIATGGIAESMIATGAVTDAKITGPIATSKLEVGTTTGTVAVGDHTHNSNYVSKQGDTMNGPLNVTSASSTYNAGWFQNTNSDNWSSALLAQSNSSVGSAVEGFATGTGPAGSFGIANPASTANALQAGTTGTGYAGHFTGKVFATGTVEAQKFIGDGSSLTNVSARPQWGEITTTALQMQPNRNYVLNNSQETVLTLPQAASFMDTVRVTSAGSGAWTIVPSLGQQIVSSLLTPKPSEWQLRPSVGGGCVPVANDLASSTDLSVLLAGICQKVYRSTDLGATWSLLPVRGDMVACSSDCGRIVTGPYNGALMTSIDGGVTWTPRISTGRWADVASSADGMVMMAAEDTGPIHISRDGGETWAPTSFQGGWDVAISSSDGMKLAARAASACFISNDSGYHWEQNPPTATCLSVGMTPDGSKLFYVDTVDQSFNVSTDWGLTWTKTGATISIDRMASSLDGVRIVAFKEVGRPMFSDDSGVSWIQYEPYKEYSARWQAIVISADGKDAVALTSAHQIYTDPWHAASQNPGAMTGGQYDSVELMHLGNGKYNVISHEGNLVLRKQ